MGLTKVLALFKPVSNQVRFAAILGRRQFSSDIIHPPDNSGVEIPAYTEKSNESLEVRKARLLYQSRKRGMLENDLLLSTFAAKFLKDMNLNQVEQYDKLINQPSNDWEIYYWATCAKPTPKEFDNDVMGLFKEHVKNLNKEKRLRQPNLY